MVACSHWYIIEHRFIVIFHSTLEDFTRRTASMSWRWKSEGFEMPEAELCTFVYPLGRGQFVLTLKSNIRVEEQFYEHQTITVQFRVWDDLAVSQNELRATGASFSKNLKSSNDLKQGKRQWLPRGLVNLSPFLDLRFFQKLDPGYLPSNTDKL